MLGIHVWLEFQFIKAHLNVLMEWNRVGSKRNKLPASDDFKIEILAIEFIMVVFVLISSCNYYFAHPCRGKFYIMVEILVAYIPCVFDKHVAFLLGYFFFAYGAHGCYNKHHQF